MRFFIAFVLCALLQLSAAFAGTQEVAALMYQTVKKTNVDLKGASTFSKKEIHRLSHEPMSANTERIHRGLGMQKLNLVVSELNSTHPNLPATALTAKLVDHCSNHSYLFIFNCLYPSHSFW